jgi:hypothetical protein
MRTPLLATLAGIAVGSAIAVGLVAGGALRVPVQRDYRDASADFLTAWERSRTGSFVVDSEFRRTLADGRTLFSSSQLVQRPPDRILRQFGGIDGQIDGHPVICSTDQNDNYSCITGSMSVPTGEEALRTELDTFRSYFTTPDPPLYQVIHAPEAGCFELIQQIAYPDPTYGRYAKMCFDEPTGALRVLERRLDGGVVETLEAFAIRTDVTGNDFNLDQDEDFDLRMDLGDAGLDPTLGTTPPVDGQPTDTADDPTREPSPDPEDLALLDNEDLVLAGSEAVRQGRAPDPYVTVLAERLEAGRFSINDSIWRRADGSATGLAAPMVLDLLRRGYYAPIP